MSGRYAIYYTPKPGSALAQFGADWLGWDSATGALTDHPSAPGLNVSAITKKPRKYGFHGTIKPPFHLPDGMQYDQLETAFRGFCASHAPVAVDKLQLSRLGAFMALIPDGNTEALGALAGEVVTGFDQFRALPTEEEMNRRRKANLTSAQEANLCEWGYPYVLDTFRFHMTLTGSLAPEVGDLVERFLVPRLEAMPLSPFEIDALTLLGSDVDGRFHQLLRLPLSGV